MRRIDPTEILVRSASRLTLPHIRQYAGNLERHLAETDDILRAVNHIAQIHLAGRPQPRLLHHLDQHGNFHAIVDRDPHLEQILAVNRHRTRQRLDVTGQFRHERIDPGAGQQFGHPAAADFDTGRLDPDRSGKITFGVTNAGIGQ